MANIEKDELIREAVKSAGKILKLAFDASELSVGITTEISYPNGNFILKFYPCGDGSLNTENTVGGSASYDTSGGYTMLGNRAQAVEDSPQHAGEVVKSTLGKRTNSGNFTYPKNCIKCGASFKTDDINEDYCFSCEMKEL